MSSFLPDATFHIEKQEQLTELLNNSVVEVCAGYESSSESELGKFVYELESSKVTPSGLDSSKHNLESESSRIHTREYELARVIMREPMSNLPIETVEYLTRKFLASGAYPMVQASSRKEPVCNSLICPICEGTWVRKSYIRSRLCTKCRRY